METDWEEVMTDFRKHLEVFTVGSDQVKIGKVWCGYVIAKPELEPKVPNFVGVLGDREYFISSAVPEKFRKPIIAHELRCFALKTLGRTEHCVHAIDFELKFVLAEDRAEYLKLRRKFFDDLIRYSASRDANFLREITASRDYLYRLT